MLLLVYILFGWHRKLYISLVYIIKRSLIYFGDKMSKMNENSLIAYSSGDIVIEFSEGIASMCVPVCHFESERDIGDNTVVNGMFVIGTEYLAYSSNENVFDKAYENGNVFNIKLVVDDGRSVSGRRVIEAIENVRILKEKTTVNTKLTNLCYKMYWFSNHEDESKIIDSTWNCQAYNNNVFNNINISSEIERVVKRIIRNELNKMVVYNGK